jgi:hypothetical protein
LLRRGVVREGRPKRKRGRKIRVIRCIELFVGQKCEQGYGAGKLKLNLSIRTTYLAWRRECKVLAVSIQARIKARGHGAGGRSQGTLSLYQYKQE